jgi:hypothetical protein
VNGASVAPTENVEHDRAVRWPLARGRHRILVTDRRGETAETTIVVR